MYKFYSRSYRSTQEAESWGTGVTQHGEEDRQGYDWLLPFRGIDPDSADASVAATAPQKDASLTRWRHGLTSDVQWIVDGLSDSA